MTVEIWSLNGLPEVNVTLCDIVNYSSYFIELFPRLKSTDWSMLQYVCGIYISVSYCIFQHTPIDHFCLFTIN